MKKLIIYAMLFLTLPALLCELYHIVNPAFGIGIGDYSIKNHLLGKDILVEINGLYKNMDIEEYVLGVLAGVMPADYELEALKAQAVIIRTNVLRQMEEKNTKDASDIDYHYMPEEERREMWGRGRYTGFNRKLERAVSDTSGLVIKKEGNYILAMYHAVSIGKTLSASEILGEDISYLVSVDSNEDVEAKDYMNVYEYDTNELKGILNLKGEDELKINADDVTENGFVKNVTVNGTPYTGEDFAGLLGLASSDFYIESIDDKMRFVCLGKGVPLGMSQYGCNRMANAGGKFKKIIDYYYKDVSIEPAFPH
ncbi:MAG: SpoIID/LytB domain-containing protein [Lachnospiraceae bacterium]|nr:SpoIID/LytB domain-containing protein [Lachnospiraceae bacterium]